MTNEYKMQKQSLNASSVDALPRHIRCYILGLIATLNRDHVVAVIYEGSEFNKSNRHEIWQFSIADVPIADFQSGDYNWHWIYFTPKILFEILMKDEGA